MLWRYIENEAVEPAFGLATDEYLVDSFRPDHPIYDHILRLYTYKDHCAILGRFQDVESEIDVSECKKLGVEINRRITGGGAIIMGQSQLGLAITIPPGETNHSTKKIFEDYSRGIIEGLSLIGIKPEFVPKNDIVVAGKKITGLAACVQENGNALFHASILLDIDIKLMAGVLKIPFEKISDKKISAVEDRLTTINKESKEKITIGHLKNLIKAGYEKAFNIKFKNIPITDLEISEIKAIEEEKYLTRDWIYQKALISSEKTSISKKTKAGMLNINMAIVNNIIKDIIITGDFFSTTEFISTLERRLRWKPINRKIITRVIEDAWKLCTDSISGIGPEVLIDCVLECGNLPQNGTQSR